jgi:hypothetical protein
VRCADCLWWEEADSFVTDDPDQRRAGVCHGSPAGHLTKPDYYCRSFFSRAEAHRRENLLDPEKIILEDIDGGPDISLANAVREEEA